MKTSFRPKPEFQYLFHDLRVAEFLKSKTQSNYYEKTLQNAKKSCDDNVPIGNAFFIQQYFYSTC